MDMFQCRITIDIDIFFYFTKLGFLGRQNSHFSWQ